MKTQAYTLSQSRETDPRRWTITTSYNNATLELRIDHALNEDQLGFYMWIDGERWEIVTPQELLSRREVALEHGDMYDSAHVHEEVESSRVWAQRDEMLRRWQAMQYILSPAVLY